MNEFIWPGVVLILGGLAWHRLGQRSVSSMPADLVARMSAFPPAEEMINATEALAERIRALESGGHTLPAIVARANDLTKDMLAMKTMLAEHRETIALLRTKNSLRGAVGGSEG